MMWQTPKPIGPVALFAALIVSGVGIVVPANTAHTDDCLAAPNSSAPEGTHWYFRIDSAKKRKCWYFRALGQSGQQVVAQSTSASEASARLQSIKPKPASKAASSASGSISTSPAGSAPPLPELEMLAVEPHPAPMIGARTDEDIERSKREGSRASSIPQALASQESPVPKVTAPAEDRGVLLMRSRADGRAPDDVESPTKRLFQICVSFLSSQQHAFIALGYKWKIGGVLALLILTFGLPVAGRLRVAMKIVPRRRERVIIDRSAPNLIDNQDQYERRDDQPQRDSERYQQESDLTGEAPLLRELPFLRSYTLPGLPNETYLYFEGRPALVGRRSADA